jgi:hypothetical protein
MMSEVIFYAYISYWGLPDRECTTEYNFPRTHIKYASSALALAENMCNIMLTLSLHIVMIVKLPQEKKNL